MTSPSVAESLILDGLVIRQVSFEDLPALEWEGEYKNFRRLYAEAFRRASLGEAVLWVAELADKRLIAQVFLQLNSERPELADGRTRAYLYGFRVRPEYRSHGLGTLMMDVAETDLLARGFRWVCLNVGRENPAARRLYERLGYRIIGSDPGRWSYIDDRGNRCEVIEPAWRMEKILRKP